MWLKPLLVPIATRLDDRLGNGRRNPVKKWWFDHEIVDGVATTPRGSNEREIDPNRRLDRGKQKIAYYPADVMPAPDVSGPVVLDRKAGLAAAAELETPAGAKARAARGEPAPEHYRATPPVGDRDSEHNGEVAGSPYRTANDSD